MFVSRPFISTFGEEADVQYQNSLIQPIREVIDIIKRKG